MFPDRWPCRGRLTRRWASQAGLVAAFLVLMTLCSSVHAGAWGYDSFDNDPALDWSHDCVSAKTTALVSQALERALEADYLEVDEGSEAVAAAEVVAAAIGRPNTSMPGELKEWVAKQSIEELGSLAALALKALDRVENPDSSELSQLWSEGGGEEWAAELADLRARLGRL